jgi:hypothetical protein
VMLAQYDRIDCPLRLFRSTKCRVDPSRSDGTS